jgi:beta-lactamase class A
MTRSASLAAATLLLAAGFGAGWAARGDGGEPGGDRRAYTQRREGAASLVNPLLDCDLAEDVLRNRELAPFKDVVQRYLAGRVAQRSATAVSVYFRELNDGIWFAIGDTERFTPASLRKLPLLIALLKAAEGRAGPALLDAPVTHDLARDYDEDQNIKPAEPLRRGATYPVRELIRRMIVHSDNNAFMLLSRVVDPAELDRVYARLRMQNPRAAGDDAFLSVQTYASFFRILYNATYLSREASEWALTLLAAADFKAGLVGGVPPGVPVAHKFGEKSEPGAFQLHDCGIVYFPENPYLLCVMSRGPDLGTLDDVIRGVSRVVYGEVAGQLGAAPAPR